MVMVGLCQIKVDRKSFGLSRHRQEVQGKNVVDQLAVALGRKNKLT